MSTSCPICRHPNRDAARFCSICAAPIILAGRFRVLRRIGQGGMGAVYQVEDLHLPGKMWAAKEMTDAGLIDPLERQRAIAGFQQEAQILVKLHHPNIPLVADSFQQGNKHYIVMEFVDGATLNDLLVIRGRPFTEPELLPLLSQLCDVLAYLHNQHPPIIFRDLKPLNIMIDRRGQVKLIDFGIARFFKPGKAKDTTLLGTPGYASPEQHGQGQTDVRSDVYALGVVLHQLLTGHDPTQTPYNLPPIRALAPAISPAMEQITNRCLQLRSQDRWQSVTQVTLALQAAATPGAGASAGTTAGAASPTGTPTRSAPNQLARAHPTNRPTTKLLMAAASLSNGQLVALLAGFVLLGAVGVWVLAPVVQEQLPAIWNNVPAFAIAGPLAYAALRRRWVALVAHLAVALTGWLTWWLRIGYTPSDYQPLLVATVVSGLVVEGGMALVPRFKGVGGDDAWRREIAWFALCSIMTASAFSLVMSGPYFATRPGMWLGAAILGGLGWFLGDIAEQWLYLQKAGHRRITRP